MTDIQMQRNERLGKDDKHYYGMFIFKGKQRNECAPAPASFGSVGVCIIMNTLLSNFDILGKNIHESFDIIKPAKGNQGSHAFVTENKFGQRKQMYDPCIFDLFAHVLG